MLDLSRRAVEGLAAIERGGPNAWRVVTELLRDTALVGLELGVKKPIEPTG